MSMLLADQLREELRQIAVFVQRLAIVVREYERIHGEMNTSWRFGDELREAGIELDDIIDGLRKVTGDE